MQYLTTISLFALAATSSASIFRRQSSQQDCSDPDSECYGQTENYLEAVCLPTNSSGYPDLNAPCVVVQAITAECIYGPAGLSLVSGTSDPENVNGVNGDADQNYTMLSNATQRVCVCESQFFSQLEGCQDCYKAHGAPSAGLEGYLGPSFIASASSSYCAVTNTPTVGFADVLYSYATGSYASSLISAASTASTSAFSDPIGNSTAVSYYFTPSVTGSAAWVVAQATGSTSSGSVTGSAGSSSGSASGRASSASLYTSGGEIVPTANAATSGSASGTASGASGTASTTGSGAGKQEAAAVAGVIAFAGFVAML